MFCWLDHILFQLFQLITIYLATKNQKGKTIICIFEQRVSLIVFKSNKTFGSHQIVLISCLSVKPKAFSLLKRLYVLEVFAISLLFSNYLYEILSLSKIEIFANVTNNKVNIFFIVKRKMSFICPIKKNYTILYYFKVFYATFEVAEI